MSDTLIIQRPEGTPIQLMLLFHGVGATPADLLPLGQRLAQEFPQAMILSIPAAFESDLGAGRQWFSVRGITEQNRSTRVAQAMPLFEAAVRLWQKASDVPPAATALIGFSQGAIMSLESTKSSPGLAARVVAIAGRFAQLPESAALDITLHLIHGKDDYVIPYAHTVQAAERLIALDGDVTADVLPFVDHEINEEVCDLIVNRLKTYLPKRRWEEALSAQPMAPVKARPS